FASEASSCLSFNFLVVPSPISSLNNLYAFLIYKVSQLVGLYRKIRENHKYYGIHIIIRLKPCANYSGSTGNKNPRLFGRIRGMVILDVLLQCPLAPESLPANSAFV